ncbi:hypothetical protein ALC53_10470 [Atta colombica]|uniref:Uncharacterized protein n=1 Tax=Atta colombica TaxID=520822 RepID=A0A151I0A8_9HYME|nr:hypothetical protein ALC53_10470 [Atta colombica]
MGEIGPMRLVQSAAGFSYTIFHPLYSWCTRPPPHPPPTPATWWWRVGGSQREACTARHPIPPHGIRALPPPPASPRSGGRRGWDAATTPTFRNHLYLVDVTTYHPLSGGGGGSGGDDSGGGGLRRSGCGSGV